MLAASVQCVAQGRISGIVYDKDDTTALPGVLVYRYLSDETQDTSVHKLIKNRYGSVTISDTTGHFLIDYHKTSDTIHFDFIGCEPEARTVEQLMQDSIVMLSFMYYDDGGMAHIDYPSQYQPFKEFSNWEQLLINNFPWLGFRYSHNQLMTINTMGAGSSSPIVQIDGTTIIDKNSIYMDPARIGILDVNYINCTLNNSDPEFPSQASGCSFYIGSPYINEGFNTNRKIQTKGNQSITSNGDLKTCAKLDFENKRIANSLKIHRNSVESRELSNGDNPEMPVFTHIFANTSYTISDNIIATLSNKTRILARAGYSTHNISLSDDDREKLNDLSGTVKVRHGINDFHKIQLIYSLDQYSQTDSKVTAAPMDFTNTQNRIKAIYQFHTPFPGIDVSAGAEHLNDRLRSCLLPGNTQMHQNTSALYAKYKQVFDYPTISLQGGLRAEYHSDAQTYSLTPQASFSLEPFNYMIVPCITFNAEYSMGYRTPNLIEKYSNCLIQNQWRLLGNPDLKPERSHNFVLDIHCFTQSTKLTISEHLEKLHNLIIPVISEYADDNTKCVSHRNMDGCYMYSTWIKTEVSNRFFMTKISYAFTNSDFQSLMFPISKHKLSASIYKKQQLTNYILDYTLSGIYQSAASDQLSAFTMWDLSLNVVNRKHITFNLGIYNIFNYKPRYYYYNAPLTTGTTFMAGIGWLFI